MKATTFLSTLAMLSIGYALPQAIPATTTTATCTYAPSATAVTPAPSTATCGIQGGDTADGVFPLNYEQTDIVPSTDACAQQCLAYSDDLCQSIAIYTEPTTGNSSCILFAYTVAQLDVQPERPPYGPGSSFYDIGCFGFDC